MASSSSFSSSFSGILQRNIQSWIAVLVPSAVSLFFAMVSSGHSVVSISITSLALLTSTAIMALKPPKPTPKKAQNQAEIKICSSEIKKVAEGGEEEEQKGYSNDPSSSSEDYSDIDSTAQGSDDGSISDDDDDDDDEESLFEICLLPYSGNFVGHEKESSKYCLMEFLTEMNEEDNMIEIDISMGSIKCSGF